MVQCRTAGHFDNCHGVRTRLLTCECEDTLSIKASSYICEYTHIGVTYTPARTHTGQNGTWEILVWNRVSPSTLLFCPILQHSSHQPTWTVSVNLNSAERGGYQYKLTGNLHTPVKLRTTVLAAASIILILIFFYYYFKPPGMSFLHWLPTSSEIPEQAVPLSCSSLVPTIHTAFAENLCRHAFLLWFRVCLDVLFTSRLKRSLPVLQVGPHTAAA